MYYTTVDCSTLSMTCGEDSLCWGIVCVTRFLVITNCKQESVLVLNVSCFHWKIHPFNHSAFASKATSLSAFLDPLYIRWQGELLVGVQSAQLILFSVIIFPERTGCLHAWVKRPVFPVPVFRKYSFGCRKGEIRKHKQESLVLGSKRQQLNCWEEEIK